MTALRLAVAKALYRKHTMEGIGALLPHGTWDDLQPWQQQPFLDAAAAAASAIRPQLVEVARMILAAERPCLAALAKVEAMCV